MNATLRLSLLGPPLIRLGDEPLNGLSPQKVKALLIYLAYTGQPQPRELLADLFFDDRPPKQAAANLRAMISRLRRQLAPFVLTDRETVTFNADADFWLDTAVLTPILQSARQQLAHNQTITPETADALTDALPLYRSEFLAGFHLREARTFGEWLLLERERWHYRTTTALQALVTFHLHRREYAAGILQARRLLRLDNLQENAHRQLMLLLARSGDRSAALSQYETCRQILAQELGVEPMAETAALYERIRSASTAVPHNLPPQFTPFVGRLDELAWLNRRLDDPGCRLLTLAGSGGAGKTRLALEIVAERAGDYLNGAAFVPLASIDDPDLLVTAVAEAIRFTFSGSKPPKQQLLDHLHGLEMLLALDNFEQVLEGAGLVADILKAAPRVTILATSREPLNLSMEWLLTVHGLAYPGAAEEETRPLAQYEAAQLFDHNARRASARFALNDASAPFVGRICQLVEGLPLALELAAAAVRERPLAEIAAAIEENTAVLATTMRDVPPRHRSVQAVFNHSWSRLTPSQRRIFARLTVFRGSFDRAAAAAVSGAAPETLARLVQKSLLRRENGRYHLHALWRQLGAEKLSAEEREEAQAAHGRYYTGWMQQQEANLTGDAQLNTLALITADIENIRAAWNWAVRQRQWEAIRQAVDSFNDWHNIRALFREGTAVYEQAIVALKEALKSKTGAPASSRPASRDAGAPGADVLLAQLLAYQGFFLFRQAEFDPAKAKLQESAALLRPLDEPRLLIKALGGLANIAIMQGDYETAGRQYRENLALARRAGLPGAIASNLEGTAMLANYAGEFDKAQQLFRQCLAMQREIGNLHQIASTLGNLATASFYLEQYAEAEKALVESLELRRSLDDQHGVILMLLNLGELALFTQEYEKARRFYEECGRVSAAARHRLGDVDSRVGLGDVCFALGEYDTAASHYLAAINMAQTAKLLPNLLLALVGMAGVLFKREQVGEAAVVFAFVQRHPALNQEIKDKGAWLAAALPPEARAAGEAQAAGMSLVEVVTAVGKDEG